VHGLTRAALLGPFLVLRVVAQSTCANFPANFVPFSSVAYVTAANSAGDHLVVGALAGGVNSLGNVPLPAATNQTFCDAQVQLAPQQFYPNVYVPTVAERSGNFSAFAGLLVDPANNQPYPGGIIPPNQLGAVFAWRIGAAQALPSARGWSPTGSMSTGRAFHAAALLPNGKVLVVGGNTGETYDPTTGTFTPAGKMLFGHGANLTATLLNDGRVLIVGGDAPFFAELYDPRSGKFVATGGTVAPHNEGLTATLLADGRVLVVGGLDENLIFSTAAAEIYDPTTGSFTRTGSLAVDRDFHSATLLQDGRVLVAGGFQGKFPGQTLNSAEIFDPATGQFASTGAMQFQRNTFFAVRLASGKVLVGQSSEHPFESAELFDPASGTFAVTGSMSETRDYVSATLLSSGQVLVAGGGNPLAATSAELYNPATGAFSPTGSMVSARGTHTATALFDGRVLVTGGYGVSGPPLTSAELYTPVIQGLVTSQTGLTFRAAQGAGTSVQNVVALSATDTIPFTVSTKTYSGGGSWLGARPGGATSGPATAPVTLTIIADATGLAAQDYYGVVTLTPTDGQHPPVPIAVVLTIVPAGAAAPPAVTPSGLVLLTTTGINAKPQALAISNLTSRALNFTGAATAAPSFFDFTPKTGTINSGQTLSISVTPSSTSLAAGVYRGSIKLTFGDGSTQTVDLLLVVSATAGKSAVRATAASCTPTKLLPVLTSIGAGFATPLAWPTSLIVQVVDDCGTSVNTGSVTASFTNGDVPISLLAIGGGTWSATWVPVHNAAGAGVRADAQQSQLNGTVQVSGQVALNPKVPIVASGGVVSSGDYTSSPALGLLASVFGTALADGNLGNSSLPLPQQLGSTSVAVSGIQLPLLYVSDSQVNVFIPYELAANATHQLIVQRGNAISVPVPISVFGALPAILATAGNGLGQGHVYKIDAQGNQILADANAPAKAGDVLVIYTVGLGPVTPSVKSGDPASFAVLSRVNAPVGVTIGGQAATVQFAGLTPGFSGLYQVNAVVPDGVTAGNQVPVLVSVAGSASSTNIYMAIK
jgi:uncharacterized protein (TIGR03437 family)